MATLLSSISEFIEKISVTDKQETLVKTSVHNLDAYLRLTESNLWVKNTFTNGSYERDTNLRPLDDVDIFAVLRREKWEDSNGKLPSPQKVLRKIKYYLEGIPIYNDKVKQSRPCITVELSKISFDILPSFEIEGGGYYIPNFDLESWMPSYPNQLTLDLADAHRNANYKLKQIIKAVKHWNVNNDKLIPSYIIEKTAIHIFQILTFTNFEEGIRLWFDKANDLLQYSYFDFKSENCYKEAKVKVEKAQNLLNQAKEKLDTKKEWEAMALWKRVFLREFPIFDIEEAKSFAKSLNEGSLKIGSSGLLSQEIGKHIPASKGYYGEL